MYHMCCFTMRFDIITKLYVLPAYVSANLHAVPSRDMNACAYITQLCVHVLHSSKLVIMILTSPTGVVYTCPDTLSLCPQAYATCSCTIISSSYVKYNQWYLSMPLCKGQIIQLLHNGTNCTSQYQQCGSIRAWNEPQSNPSSVGNIICETTTLLINAHPNLADLKFNCRSAANTAPYGSTTLNIIGKTWVY